MAYTFEQEVLINGLIKERIRDLQLLIHETKRQLSERQYEKARQDLEQYQELQYQNRLNRQINMG